MTPTTRKAIAWAALALVIVVLTIIALGHTGPVEQRRIRLLPFQEFPGAIACVVQGCLWAGSARRFLLVNGLGNVVVFMPVGMVFYIALTQQAPELGHPVLYGLLLGASLSLVFEVAQLWIPGRVTALDDIILNAAGAWLGSLAMKWASPVLRPGN